MRKPPPYNKKVNPISFMISPITTFTDEELALSALEEYLEEGEDRDEMEAFIAVSYTHLTLPTTPYV